MSVFTLAAAMTPFPHSVAPGATLEEARKMMAEHGIHHLPVCEGRILLGVVSASRLAVAENMSSEPGVLVEAVYARDPYVADIHAPLAEVVEQMAEAHISATLVTRNDALAGILTHTDVCRVLAVLLDPDPTPSPSKVA